MIRIILDELTKKVLGYEDVTDYLQIYNDDILMDSIPQNIIGAYFENGIIINEKRDDYHMRIEELRKQLAEWQVILSNKQDKVTDALLNGTLEELKKQFEEAEEKSNVIIEQIKREEEEHSKELERFYLEQNRKKDKQISPIYNSSVCLLIKNENQYLKEWLDHYLSVGFDHIFIYDNNSDIPVKSIVKEWYSNEILEKITVIDYLGSHNDLQTESYNDFLKNYGMQTRWVLFADSDEFVQFPNGNQVNEFLKDKEIYTAIHVDFIEFGADGQENYEDKPVQERFTTPVTINEGIYYKDFLQPNRIDKMRTHYPIFDKNKHKIMEKDREKVVINHYYTKSFEEWKQKMKRGSCDPNYLKRESEFFLYNPDMTYLYTGENNIQEYNG